RKFGLILTTCTRGNSVTPRVTVYAGVHNLADPTDPTRVVVEATKVVIHPKNSFSYDLALIQLSRPLTFTRTLRPICLPPAAMQDTNVTKQPLTVIGWGITETGRAIYTKQPLTVIDWGITETGRAIYTKQPLTVIGWGITETGTQPTTLRELSQVAMDWQSCKKVYGEYVTNHHFCSTASNDGHICLGDSGGPTMIAKDGRFYLRGVISFVATKDCNLDFPDGHTSVTHFLPWIQDVTGISV
ncbi:Serine proteases trypsin domain, partial [Trinorchestia longiramus]